LDGIYEELDDGGVEKVFDGSKLGTSDDFREGLEESLVVG